MHVNKKLAIILSGALFAAACGNSGETKPGDAKDSSSSTSSAPAATTSAASSKGLELIGASDCTTCHRLDKNGTGASIGPAYNEVAAKYAPAADTTIDRLVKKIKIGGSGVWGTIPMTPHPMLADADIKEMLKYIMSLKKP